MQLIYRGQAFQSSVRFVPTCAPSAVNWRYQVYNDATVPQKLAPVRLGTTPRIVNWRWQMAVTAS